MRKSSWILCCTLLPCSVSLALLMLILMIWVILSTYPENIHPSTAFPSLGFRNTRLLSNHHRSMCSRNIHHFLKFHESLTIIFIRIQEFLRIIVLKSPWMEPLNLRQNYGLKNRSFADLIFFVVRDVVSRISPTF